VKANLSRRVHERGVSAFAGQTGCGEFAVSCSNVPIVRRYIARQAEHHRKMTCQDEFRAILNWAQKPGTPNA
jgi:hypothetical protein